jgi:hypothetical protein
MFHNYIVWRIGIAVKKNRGPLNSIWRNRNGNGGTRRHVCGLPWSHCRQSDDDPSYYAHDTGKPSLTLHEDFLTGILEEGQLILSIQAFSTLDFLPDILIDEINDQCLLQL